MTGRHASDGFGDFAGASEPGQMETGPDTDALAVLQRVRDGLLRESAKSSSEGNGAA